MWPKQQGLFLSGHYCPKSLPDGQAKWLMFQQITEAH